MIDERLGEFTSICFKIVCAKSIIHCRHCFQVVISTRTGPGRDGPWMFSHKSESSGPQGWLAGNLTWAGWKFFSQPTLNFSSQPPTLKTAIVGDRASPLYRRSGMKSLDEAGHKISYTPPGPPGQLQAIKI
jgi:hypothetical protein